MHIDGAGKPTPYSAADCALISEARRQRTRVARLRASAAQLEAAGKLFSLLPFQIYEGILASSSTQ